MKDITNRQDIERQVTAFYNRVFQDEMIGFIFTEIASISPDSHFPVIVDFWEMILFSQNKYHGNMVAKHVQLSQQTPIDKVHFDRWSCLFRQTLDDFYQGPVADMAKIRAESISFILQAKIHTLSKIH
jgi:hemoglobin